MNKQFMNRQLNTMPTLPPKITNSVWNKHGGGDGVASFSCEASELEGNGIESGEVMRRGSEVYLYLPDAGYVHYKKFVPKVSGSGEDAEITHLEYIHFADGGRRVVYTIFND